jgi:hypothetical protein
MLMVMTPIALQMAMMAPALIRAVVIIAALVVMILSALILVIVSALVLVIVLTLVVSIIIALVMLICISRRAADQSNRYGRNYQILH